MIIAIRPEFERDLQKAIRVKGHYRRLPNGKTIWISEHDDKRNKRNQVARPGRGKKLDQEKLKKRVVHATHDETHYVNHKGETKKYKHAKHMELTQDDIHAQLNRGLSVDMDLATKVFMTENMIGDLDELLDKFIDDEADRAEATGQEPKFTNRGEAMKWFQKTHIRPILKDLQQTYGETTTPALAAGTFKGGRARLNEHFEDAKDHEGFGQDYQSMAHMASNHYDTALEASKEEMESIRAAKKVGPNDAPHIDSISTKLKFFGHQAQTLAQLNLLKKGIIDVDMGGGKGLILPADAMNLMSQGKVKKPLVVVPGATLEQNAKKILEYTENGMNVFMIDNNVINEQYDGDLDAMQEDIQNAPPNTIFMASYSVFSYNTGERDDKGKVIEDQFGRAEALGGSGFDYIALDESHNIKNVASKRFKAMQHLTHIPYKRVASGTFLSNNPKDILGQLLFLHPHMAISEKDFQKKYGMETTAKGIQWDYNKLKDLREDLENLGMVSLRRSAWIHLLPERNEKPAIVKMDKNHEKVHEAVLNEVMDDLEAEMKKNPRLKKIFENDDELSEEELPPNVLGPLNLLSAITDYPHELATSIEDALKSHRENRAKAKEEGRELNAEEEELRRTALKYSPAVRAALASLKGTVSPKAKDVYNKIDEHFKDPNNGKFMVFVQRKASAQHIMDNMPDKWKSQAMYFDASKMGELPSFTQDEKGPKILVAVDASIKEGMNMQICNAQYRYDHHYSPGNQEQGYARNWRFGQDKPVNIHLGIVDGGIDVTKYARLVSKLHTNQLVVSDLEDDDSFEAYKLSLDNIRNHRHAGLLDDYFDMNKRIMDFQMNENKDLQKKFGSKGFARSTGKQIGGKKAKNMHGRGAYVGDMDLDNTPMPNDKEIDSLLGHFRDQHHSNKKRHAIYDSTVQDDYFPETIKLLWRHKARGEGAKVEDTIDQYNSELDEPLSAGEKKLLAGTLNAHLSKKKHTPHSKQAQAEEAAAHLKKQMGIRKKYSYAHEDAQALLKHLKKQRLVHMGEGKVENPKIAEKFWAKLESENGKAPAEYKKLVMGVAAVMQELHGGWAHIKEDYESLISDEE